MDEVRRTEADYPGLEPEGDEHLLAEQAGHSYVRVTGRGRRHVAATSDRRKAKDDLGDREGDDESSGHPISVQIAPDRSMKQDWLYRGDRQPLASMGSLAPSLGLLAFPLALPYPPLAVHRTAVCS